ncbi:right-handed parallel beta-helix repeat-containing protein [bacterium]|nr:right-handed parallel beta-helix repeat-containing protein [bacterium]
MSVEYQAKNENISYTISDSGYYALTNTRIDRTGDVEDNKTEIVVRIDEERVVFRAPAVPNGSFDTPLGFVPKGATIRVDLEGPATGVSQAFRIVKKDAVTVAAFRNEFENNAFPKGWRYMWNNPASRTGSDPGDLTGVVIAEPRFYTDLLWDAPQGIYRPAPTETSPTASPDRYVIASYEIDKAGFYAITESSLKATDAQGGNSTEVLIHIDDHSPILRRFARAGKEAVSFDTDLAYLESGSSIYVCLGPDATNSGDLSSIDYHIVRLDAAKLIRDQIADATDPHVRIFPTRYYADTIQIGLSSVHDLEINGYGATYLLTNHDQKFITLRSCSNVRILGLTMDYDPLHFTQGEILAIDGRRITLKPHQGYPTPKLGEGNYSTKALAHDPSTMRWKLETTVSNVEKVTQAGENYILEMGSEPLDLNWAVGDYMSCYEKGVGRVVALLLCEDVLLKDLTVHQYGGWGISSSKGIREIYDGLRLTPGPKSLLATIERLRAGDYDGINLHTPEAPTIRNCLIEANCDDAIHAWGEMAFVLKEVNNSNVIQVSSRGNAIQEGMEVYLQAPSGKLIRTVARLEESPVSPEETEAILSGPYPHLRLYLGFLNNRYQLTLDEPVTLAIGDLVYPPAKCGKGLRIENNVIRNDPGRGMVLKCVDGVIAGNEISHMGGPGVKAEVEAEIYGTGGFAENLVIRNNRFDTVAAHTVRTANLGKAGAILFHCAGKNLMRFDNLRIENNTFVNCYGVNIVIADAMNVFIKGNHFENPGHNTSEWGADYAPSVQEAIVWVHHVSNVVLDDQERNTYTNKAPEFAATAGGPIQGVLYPQEKLERNKR